MAWIRFLTLIILLASISVSLQAGTKNKNKNTFSKNRPITINDLLKKKNPPKPKRKPQPNTGLNNNYNPNAISYDNTANEEANFARNYGNNNRQQQPINQPSNTKIIPPVQRLATEQAVRPPSWTHCVNKVNLDDAWLTVRNPGYPEKFNTQKQCSWIVTAKPGNRVRISIVSLDLTPPSAQGCDKQYIEIIEPAYAKAQVRYCGNHIPGDYVSVGNELRLDLKADQTAIPRMGFVAAFKQDTELPGLRELNYYKNGQPGSSSANPNNNFNPGQNRPPSNPQAYTRTRPRRTTTTAKPARPVPVFIAGQNHYGTNHQPVKIEDNVPTEDPNKHLYIIIAVIVVIVLLAAAAYVFRRFFFEKVKQWKKAHDAQSKKAGELHDKIYGDKKSLPAAAPPPLPPSNLSRTGSVVTFEDEQLNKSARSSISSDQGIGLARHGSFSSMRSVPGNFGGEQLYNRQPFNGGMVRSISTSYLPDKNWGGQSEPVYEDDTMSLRSTSSYRSTNRHPEHESIKRKKILDRRRSQLSKTGSIASLDLAAPTGNAVYNTDAPTHFQPQVSQAAMFTHPQQQHPMNMYNAGFNPSIYGGSLPGMYGYAPNMMMQAGQPHVGFNPMQQTMGMAPGGPMAMNAPPNLGMPPNMVYNQMFGPPPSYSDSNQFKPPQTNLIPMHKSQTMPSKMNLRAANEKEPIYAPLSDGIGSTISVSNSYNPPDPHWNKMRESVLRSAKSMNDLTAMNTKLNESKSWQLPPSNHPITRTNSMLF